MADPVAVEASIAVEAPEEEAIVPVEAPVPEESTETPISVEAPAETPVVENVPVMEAENEPVVEAEITPPVPVEAAPAENGATLEEIEDDAVEPPKKRGRPASGTTPTRRTPQRKSKESKPQQQPTRRSARRSASSVSSEPITPTEKIEEPMETEAAVNEKENIDTKNTESDEPSAEEKIVDADAIQSVEAEA